MDFGWLFHIFVASKSWVQNAEVVGGKGGVRELRKFLRIGIGRSIRFVDRNMFSTKSDPVRNSWPIIELFLLKPFITSTVGISLIYIKTSNSISTISNQ